MTLEEQEAQYQADLVAGSGRGAFVPVIKMERKANVGFLRFIPLPAPTNGLPKEYSQVMRYEYPISYNLMWTNLPQYVINKRLYQAVGPLSAEDSALYDEVSNCMKTLHNYEYHVATAVKEGKEHNSLTPTESGIIAALKSYDKTRDWSTLTQTQAEVHNYLFGKNSFASYSSGYTTDTFMYGYIVDTDIAKFKDYKGSIACILFINKKGDMGTTFHDNKDKILREEDENRKKKGQNDWLTELQSPAFDSRTMSLKVTLGYAGNNAYYTIKVVDEDPTNIPEERQEPYNSTNWIADLTRCASLFDSSAFSEMKDKLRRRLTYYESAQTASTSASPQATVQQPTAQQPVQASDAASDMVAEEEPPF